MEKTSERLHLSSVTVGPFKSIEKPCTVTLDPRITVLVGMNEAGKTVFLQALDKARSVEASTKYDVVEDYPRRSLTAYEKKHATEPETAAILRYRLGSDLVSEVNSKFGCKLPPSFEYSVKHAYDNKAVLEFEVDEEPVVRGLLTSAKLSTDSKTALKKVKTLREAVKALGELEGTPEDQAFRASLESRVKAADESQWDSVVEYEVSQYVAAKLPRFLYFDDYNLLPGKLNLSDLRTRVEQAKQNPKVLEPKHRAVLAFLRMASVTLDEVLNPSGYETIKAKLEGISNTISDQVFKFWKQNEELDVECDVRTDDKEQAPFNSGPNLYIRVKNRRHRATVPFDRRSRGFIWFFSFLVWFDSVKKQLATAGGVPAVEPILLLDEPGLSLHALAQKDFLDYIDTLAEKHQVLYTTHSPFMVRFDRMHEVRVVEDRRGEGTVITENLAGTDPRTIFPLQAALGYTVAQNLFIGKRNLLVEGPSELIYLRFLSEELARRDRVGLREDVTIVPAGGLDKVATFIALLGANELELAVVHDTTGVPDQRLADLVRAKIIRERQVRTFADFRGEGFAAGDVEDLFTPGLYLELFNNCFATPLKSRIITEKELPKGDRIVDRLERFLDQEKLVLRPSGGFNHYAVAAHMARKPPQDVDEGTLARFEALFSATNPLFSDKASD